MSQKRTTSKLRHYQERHPHQVVDQVVAEVIGKHGFDEDGEPVRHGGIIGTIQLETQKCIKETIDGYIKGQVAPTVSQLVREHKVQQTNGFGEPQKPPMSISEYVGTLAKECLAERVDDQGKAVSPGAYDLNRYKTRLQYYVAQEAQNEIRKAIAKMMENANKSIIEAVRQTITAHTEYVLKSLKR